MKIRATFCSSRCLLAALTICSSPALPGAEPIRFSKPAVAIAAPDRAEPKLPESRVTGLDFSAPPVAAPMTQPMMVPPSIIFLDPRDRKGGREDESDDRTGRRDLYDLKELRKLPGLRRDQREQGQKDLRGSDGNTTLNPFNPNRTKLPGLNDPWQTGRSENSPSLSPVTKFDWEESDSSVETGGSSSRNRKGQRNRNPNPFDVQTDEEDGSPRSPSSFDLFSSRPKEKPSRELIEHRAAFEKLLNPNTELAIKSPNSLDPVSELDPTRPASSVTMPTLGQPKINGSAHDPMQAYNQQQTSLRGPRMEDVNSRYAPSTSASSAPNIPARFQTPLSRQPTMHDLPSRKF
jgi:hypothetical protein